MTTPAISLVVACYHERPHLDRNVRRIEAILNLLGRPYEFIFVDDASRDDTPDVIRNIAARLGPDRVRTLFHERNEGRGRTVSDGLALARGGVAGFIDIDLEIPETILPALIGAVLDGADVATVWRIYEVRMTRLLRHLTHIGYAWLVHRVVRPAVRDTEAGCKFFRRERIPELLARARDPRWFWDTEVMAHATRLGYAIREFPTAFVPDLTKRSTVRHLPDILAYLRALWRFRRTHVA